MIFLSENTPNAVISHLAESGKHICKVHKGIAQGAVASHADIYMCKIADRIFTARDGEIGVNYPENASFCAAALDKYFIHNLKITCPRLLEYAKESGLIPLHVNQGYTKCSCAIVDGSSIITSDRGIIRSISAVADINILAIEPGHIELPGHEYGFIGGACGLAGGELIFCGNIHAHPDGERIINFCSERGVAVKSFDFPLLDIGSIIEAPLFSSD